MKAVNIVLGFLVFSIVVSMMFAFTSEMLTSEQPKAADEFNALAGDYKSFANEFDEKGSTTREMQDAALGDTAVGTDEPDVASYKGVFSGVKLAINFFVDFEHIVHNATGDANDDGYIDKRITNGIIAVFFIIIAFVIIHFIRAFKMET